MTGETIETHPPVPALPGAAAVSSGAKHRRSLLELAPLELDCMHALWVLGSATVRDVRDRIAPHRPRAYTTIMTILDRLARKGAVERSKVGRAYLYRANLSAEEARSHAVGQVIENFFGGSPEALLSQLHNSGVRVAARTTSLRSPAPSAPRGAASAAETPAAMAAAAGATTASSPASPERGPEPKPARRPEQNLEQSAEHHAEATPQSARRRLDETLL
jgi:predicted transcriptional regulator